MINLRKYRKQTSSGASNRELKEKDTGVGDVVFLNGDSAQNHPITIVSAERISGNYFGQDYKYKGVGLKASGEKVDYEFNGHKAFFLKGSVKTIYADTPQKEIEKEPNPHIIKSLEERIKTLEHSNSAFQKEVKETLKGARVVKTYRRTTDRDIGFAEVTNR